MNKKHFLRSIYIIILIFIIIIISNDYLSKRGEEILIAKSISSLRQVYFWTAEYKSITLKEPVNLKDVIRYFTEKSNSKESDSLILALNEGSLNYQQNPILGEPMIRWKINKHIINVMPDGNIRLLKNE
jgi:hypothetical protein